MVGESAVTSGCVTRFRQTEVEDFHRTVGADLDVGRFQIAMHDVFFVRGFEGIGDLLRDGERFFEGNRALPDSVGQRRARYKLHHEVVRADVEQGADVRMVQSGDGAGFALEAVGELLRGDFDGDVASQPRIAGFPHFAHAAFADGGDDFVGAEFCAGSQVHGGSRVASIQYTESTARMAGSAIRVRRARPGVTSAT